MDFNDDDAGPSHYYAHEEVFDEFRSDSDQSDNDSIPPLPPPTVKHRPKTLKGIIATLYLALDGVVRIDVRRDYVLEDALVECKKEDFSPKKLLKVKFALEHAIDLGGPKREFFHLVSTEATKYLIGDFGKFFTTNALAVQNRVLFALGQYCGMSVTQGGNGFPYFHHLVYEYFVTGAVSCTIDIDRDCIPYGILKYILDKLDTADSKDDIQAVFHVDEATEFLYATGYTKPVLNLGLDDKDNIQSILVAYHCFLKVKSEMDQFIEGLRVTGVLDFVRESPSVLKHMFVLIKKKLTAEELKSLFKFECGLEVDSLEPIEKQSWRFFCNFLDMCEDDCGQCIDCTISDVLVFFTGTDNVPPQGFDTQPKIDFLYTSDTVPIASTCDLTLRLPTSHNNLESFVDSFHMAVKGSPLFGRL